MSERKHKRKVSKIIIFTSDAADARVKQIRLKPGVSALLTLIGCILLGAIIGYAVNEKKLWQRNRDINASKEEALALARTQNEELQLQIEDLTLKLETLSNAVNEQSQAADALQEELERRSLPTEYPLTSSAGIEVVEGEEPMVIFTASDGLVVSSANGTVVAVEEDESSGYCVTVDHGNGYLSLYGNRGDVQVRVGDEITAGTTLFLISDSNKELFYRIMYNGVYINPTEMISING